ncbi:hypothetical protein ACWNT8_08845 [Pigmentibacter ruber]|uniref:hypothetical protein n=1 Tax=Pigmentibacter ruber TaxID=2683196 RepID=UPI00131A8777|nr:hypothetical protein [Pigmentibacter ruber]BFD32610.1 hypothetical protein GTC16762_22280 [Pigmentibacter ruber]
MKSNSNAQKTASEIAQEIFKVTKVESSFDRKGRFLHLIAKLEKKDFIRLYSPATTVTIFIQGFWLQLMLNGKNMLVLNREDNISFNIEIIENDYHLNKLKISYQNKILGLFTSKKIMISTKPNTTDEYFFIAKSIVKILQKIRNRNYGNELNNYKYPVIQIIPNDIDKIEFDSNLVNIQ